MKTNTIKALVISILVSLSIFCSSIQLPGQVSNFIGTPTGTSKPFFTQTPSASPPPPFTQTPYAPPTATMTVIPKIDVVGEIQPIPKGFVYLGNKKTLALGFNMSAGGAIGSLLYQGRELVDHHDYGRYIQLSLYDGNQQYPQGGGGNRWKNWSWNPVQAGSALYQGAKVLKYFTNPNEIYIKSYGKEWGKDDVNSDVIFETWAWDRDTYFEVVVRATHIGSDTHAVRRQEFPAAYMASSLTTLSGYLGDSPFTAQPFNILRAGNKTSKCVSTQPTENWLAFGDKKGSGLILALPPQPYLTSGWGWCVIHPLSFPVPYMAPRARFDNPPNGVHDAMFYLIPGPIDKGRAIVYNLIPHTTWTFNLNSTEGWQNRSGNATVNGGVLTAQLSPDNFLSYAGLNISGPAVPAVKIRARALNEDTKLCLSFVTIQEPYWDLDRNNTSCITLTMNKFQDYTFEFQGQKIGNYDAITQYRLSASQPGTIDIDSLAVIPGAH